MKLDRRCFLSLGIGAAAGTALSPLPWKITDDLSIWTQNWPWTPVPPDGEITYTNSVCTLCRGGCGITVRKVDDRVVKIEGMKGHPVNDGGICTLGLAGPQLLYSPTRVKYPMKKENGRWKRISWTEGIEMVTAKLKALRQSGKPHTVACVADDDQGTAPLLMSRFMTAYGSPNFFRPSSSTDMYALVQEKLQGGHGIPGFDLENADFILSFGSGVLDGWGAPVRMFKVNSRLKERRGKLVQAEPRLSNTAAKADQWLPLKPGTEGVLALGFAHVILRESLYHRHFAEQYADGFDNWKQAVLQKFDPERVAAVTGINAAVIKSVGREFARATNPIAICGRGEGDMPGSFQETAAVHALNALVGGINRKGGVWRLPSYNYIAWPEVSLDSTAARAMQKERIDGAGGEKFPDARYLLTRLPEMINKGATVEMLLVSGVNPVYSLPGGGTARQAFERIPFKVSFSSFMDETTEMADLVLPNHFYLERYADVPVSAGLAKPLIGLCRPVVKPQLDTRHVGDVVIQIARSMGGSVAAAFPWDSYDACLRDTLGYKWSAMNKSGYWYDAAYRPAPWMEGFETDTGRFMFPDPRMLTRQPVVAKGEPGQYPLTLIACDSMRLSAGEIGTPPFLVKTVSDTVLKDKEILVEVNPKTAADLGLKAGRFATLKTPVGSARVKINTDNGIMPGLIAMQRGLGHTAFDKYLAGKGVNTNDLIGPVDDPDSGYNAAWGIRASLTKA